MSLKYGGMYVLIVHNVILRNRCAQQAKKYLEFNNPQQERERERKGERGKKGRWCGEMERESCSRQKGAIQEEKKLS